MKKELRVCDTGLNLGMLECIDDPFVQEVLHFWKIQNKEGFIYWVPAEGPEPKDVASFILLEKKKDWSIRGTWTRPEYRHQGLSSFLLWNIISEFDLLKPFDYIWVNITPGAENLYLQSGFNIYGKRLDADPPMNVGVYSGYDKETEKQKFIEKFPNHELHEEKS